MRGFLWSRVSEGTLYGVEKRRSVIRLDRRLRIFARVHVIDAHPGQENKRRARIGEHARNAQAVAFSPAEFYVEYSHIECRFATQKRDGFGCGRDRCHVLCTGKLKNLLNVECDQEFVVQDKAALASQQAARDRQKLVLPMELSFVLRIESGSI